MDIDIIFEDHCYAARRHGQLCTCTGNNNSSESEEDSEMELEEVEEAEDPHLHYGKELSGRDEGNREEAGGDLGKSNNSAEENISRHGPFCACGGADSDSSSESSSEDEGMEEGSVAEKGGSDLKLIGVESEMKEILVPEKASSGMASANEDPELFAYFDSLKWEASWNCYGCKTPTQHLLPYCTPCFKKTQWSVAPRRNYTA